MTEYILRIVNVHLIDISCHSRHVYHSLTRIIQLLYWRLFRFLAATQKSYNWKNYSNVQGISIACLLIGIVPQMCSTKASLGSFEEGKREFGGSHTNLIEISRTHQLVYISGQIKLYCSAYKRCKNLSRYNLSFLNISAVDIFINDYVEFLGKYFGKPKSDYIKGNSNNF